MSDLNPFSYIQSIINGKYIDDKKLYIPFIVNKSLSAYHDMIFYINEINMNGNLSKDIQYDYLYYAIKKIKRPFKPWPKKAENKDLDVISKYFQCSERKAKEYLKLLSSEQLKIIKKYNEEGGCK